MAKRAKASAKKRVKPIPAGYRSDLKGLIQSSYPMFWEVDR